MTKLKKIGLVFAEKVVVSIVIAVVFSILMMTPGYGYKGSAETKVLYADAIGYLWVDAYINITYHPLFFPLSWLNGKGKYMGEFIFISRPTYYFTNLNERTGDMSAAIANRSPADLQREALERSAIKQLYINIPFLLLAILAIQILSLQDLYIGWVLSVIVFSFFLEGEAFAVFLAFLLIVILEKWKAKEGFLLRIWNFLVEEYKKRQKNVSEKLERIDIEKLPLIYKLIMKIPLPSLTTFFGELHGIFWAVIVPIFIVATFLSGFVTLVYFPFPINVITFAIVPTTIFLFFLRVTVERFINEWNAMVNESKLDWNVDKLVNEYLEILDRQKKREEK